MAEQHTPLIKKAGVEVGRGRNINLIEGSGVTLTVSTTDYETAVTIAAAGGGAGVTVKEDDISLGTATTMDFHTGFDVALAAGEAEITMDLTEVTVLTGLAFGGNVE